MHNLGKHTFCGKTLQFAIYLCSVTLVIWESLFEDMSMGFRTGAEVIKLFSCNSGSRGVHGVHMSPLPAPVFKVPMIMNY